MTQAINEIDSILVKIDEYVTKGGINHNSALKLTKLAKRIFENVEKLSSNVARKSSTNLAIGIDIYNEYLQSFTAYQSDQDQIDPIYDQDTFKKFYQLRRARDRIFGDPDIFADPAWDILLDLAYAEKEDRSISVTSACIAACVPPTTALRWVSILEARGYIERTPDTLDARRKYLKLTNKSRKLLSQLFIDIYRRQLISY